jgi:hypothetical protein
MRLTDRSFPPYISQDALVHIVLTGVTTDSPEGSSYKATIGSLFTDNAVIITGTGINSSVRKSVGNIASGDYSASLGGLSNSATTNYSTVVGGYQNIISGGTHSFIGGGSGNTISCTMSFIGGGYGHNSNGNRSVIGGGYCNVSSSGEQQLVVAHIIK